MNQSLILTIIDLIEENLRRKISIDDLAKQCGYSRSYIQHQFKATTGFSISYYQRTRNLSLAAARLAEGEQRILDVAIEFGFESQEAFARAFRQYTSTTPSRLLGQQTWARRVNFERIDAEKLEKLHHCQSLPIAFNTHPSHRWGCYVFTVDSCERNIEEVTFAISKAYENLMQRPYSASLNFDQAQVVEFREHNQEASSTFPMSIAFPFSDDHEIPPELLEITVPTALFAEVTLPNPSYIPTVFHPLYYRIFNENKCYFSGLPAFWCFNTLTGELHHRCQVEPIAQVNSDPIWSLFEACHVVKLNTSFLAASHASIPASKRAGTRRLTTLVEQLTHISSSHSSLEILFDSPCQNNSNQYHYALGETGALKLNESSEQTKTNLQGLYLSTQWQSNDIHQLENQIEQLYLRLSQHHQFQYRAAPELIRIHIINKRYIEFDLLTPVEKRATSRQKAVWFG